jgi:prefoldin subunit 5
MNQQVNEQQLMQLAQNEEATLKSKQDFFMQIKNVLIETVKSIDGLTELQKKPGKVFVRLGAGILVEAEIKNTETCKRTFGENGFKEAKISETIKWLEDKQGNFEKQLVKIQAEINASQNNLKQLFSALQQIEAEKQKNISVK